MIKKILPILFICSFLTSCFKFINIDNNISYNVEFVHDISIDQNDSTPLDIYIHLLAGDPTNEYITMTISGVPDNVGINCDSLTFRPNYTLSLMFSGHFPKPGKYPITIKMVSPTYGTKFYTLNLTVTSFTDCTSQFKLQYNYKHPVYLQGYYSSNSYAYISRSACDTLYIQVIKDSTEPGTSFVDPYVIAIFGASINCSAKTINIYPQKADWIQSANEAIKGSGTFVPVTDSTAIINFTDTIFSAGSQINSINTITIY